MNGTIIFIVVLVFILIGIICILFGFRRLGRAHLIQDTPTSKIRSMALGLVELYTNISRANYIRTPFAQVDCVYYEYTIQEYQEDTRRDSDGEIEVDYEWKTIERGKRYVDFYVSDDTGEVLVDPTHADITAPLKNTYYQTRDSIWTIDSIRELLTDWDNEHITKLDTSKWGLTLVDPNEWVVYSPRVGDKRYYEYYLEPGERLFIMGTAASNTYEPGGVYICKGTNEPTFIITHQTEEELLSSLNLQASALIIVGCILIIVGLIISSNM